MSQARFMIAGTNSGCGKTTITCALMKAFLNRGSRIAPFKCGPDYIDPMFHKHITNTPSVNLDLFFLEEEPLKAIMHKHMADKDLSIVEGVMGLYDGIGTTTKASSFDVARATKTPIILVVNAKGMSISLSALIQGYIQYGARDLIKGVILNNVGKGMYMFLKQKIEEETGIKVLGYFEKQEEAVIESRHLGLITADEIIDLDQKIEMLADAAEKSIDLDTLENIAKEAPIMEIHEPLSWQKHLNAEIKKNQVCLAAAMDKAFCFYYEDNLRLLEEIGVKIIPFSPLNNEPVPKMADGLYLGGGYPEVYAEILAKNDISKETVKNAIESGMPCIAECGGFMYLHDAIEDLEHNRFEMASVIKGTSTLTKKLGPFGYIDISTKDEGLLGHTGCMIKGHEFHYSASDHVGHDLIVSKQGKKTWEEGYHSNVLYAGYPHLYFYSHIESVVSFKEKMLAYQKRK